VEASVKQTGEQDQAYFNSELPIVYKYMATVLEDRGVYPSALEYVKESINAKSDDPFALNLEAKVFSDLERYPECIAAAQAAIQLSDGKYPWMQFQLGYCYFSINNWTQAAASFRIAADADPTDAVSAFNLALCLSRQGYDADAQQWFREALKRKPDEALRSKILSALH
jgi:tetratricopeptide (TPR) repeat protein